jgi:hypothetical protein
VAARARAELLAVRAPRRVARSALVLVVRHPVPLRVLLGERRRRRLRRGRRGGRRGRGGGCWRRGG